MDEFTAHEVKEAIFKMNPLGPPGPNGFPTCFYQNNWLFMRKAITKFVLETFLNRRSLDSINSTYITLIPKIKQPIRIRNFRPISLYNVLYKIIATMLVNRLKLVLNHIISPLKVLLFQDNLLLIIL